MKGRDQLRAQQQQSDARPILPPPTEPMAVARAFASERHHHHDGLLLRHWRGQWWAWKGSHWAEIELRQVRAAVYDFTEHATYQADQELKPWAPNRHRVANVLEALSGIVLLPQRVDQPAWIRGGHDGVIVACRNGLLDVQTGTLLAHTPAFFNQTGVPFDYDPDAPAPKRWLAFLGQLWGEDGEQITALQEWFGYVLSGRLDLHKILLLVGPTRAGRASSLACSAP